VIVDDHGRVIGIGQDSELAALRAAVAETGRALLARGLVAATGGNVSARLPGRDLLVVTPSGIPYPAITPDDIVVLEIASGRQVVGTLRPSVESPTHLRLMRERADVNAAVHTHSIFASVVASARQEIPVFLDSMAERLGGPLRLVPHGFSGSPETQEAIAAALRERDAVLLANHGAFVVGRTLETALAMAELVEMWAQAYVFSHLIGGPVSLPEAEVRRTRQWFLTSYGQEER
jgi:L-ribulose-5-phosphate 4-epimerase